MFEIIRYPSEGGLRIKGCLMDGEFFTITRLSKEGETRVSFSGLDLDYDTKGDLVFAALHFRRFVMHHSSGDESEEAFSESFWDMVKFMEEHDVELSVEVDLTRNLSVIIKKQREKREELGAFNSSFYNGRLIPVKINDGQGVIGEVGLWVMKGSKGISFAAGSIKAGMGINTLLHVDMECLNGEVGEEGALRFLIGV